VREACTKPKAAAKGEEKEVDKKTLSEWRASLFPESRRIIFFETQVVQSASAGKVRSQT